MKHLIESQAHDSEHGDFQIVVKWYEDEGMGAPWKEHDGHGIVREARVPRYHGRGQKKPGEVVIYSDKGMAFFYDYAETLKIARRNGWGLSEEEKTKLQTKLGRPPTAREIAARSVVLDMEFLGKWCRGEIYWVGYTVEVDGMSYEDSLWGIMSNDMDHHGKEAVEQAEEWLANELKESADAAARDILTV